MDRRIQLAIDEDFERLVRESPPPRLMNGDITGDHGIFKEQNHHQIVRPVPTGLVRNRAAFQSPYAKPRVSSHAPVANSVNVKNDAALAANESIEEIFEYLKQKSIGSSGENLVNSFSNVGDNDHNESVEMQKDASVETDHLSDSYMNEIDTLDNSYDNDTINKDGEVNRQDKEREVSSTVYNSYDEVDMGDTGYATSNLRDIDLSVSDDESMENESHRIQNQEQSQNLHHSKHGVQGLKDHGESRRVNCTANCEISNCDDSSSHKLQFPHEIQIPSHELQATEHDIGERNTEENHDMSEIECTEIREEEEVSLDEDSVLEEEGRLPCLLYMWIIKPIPGTQFICVEGTKQPDEDGFWKSGVVTDRIDSKTVLTQSGSIYQLMGDIEFADAVYAGFSRDTVEAFRKGFPVDWKKIIEDHFKSGLLDRTDAGQTDVLTSTVNDPALETVKESSSNGKVQEYVLSKWLPKPLGKGICVEGLNSEDMLWHSSAIEKRVNGRRLVTSNGSICKLKGNIDKLQAREENIPDAIVAKFQKGFPKDWQELIQEHFTTEWLNRNEKTSKTIKNKKEVESNKLINPKVVKKQKHVETDERKRASSQNKRKQRQKKRESVKKQSGKDSMSLDLKANMSVDSVLTDTSVVSADCMDQTVLTPAGKVVDLSSLKRSRAGRIVKPPLHSYTGQGYAFTEDGSLTIIGTTDYAKKYLKEIEDSYKDKSNRFKRYTYYSLNDTKSSVSSASSVVSKSHNTSNSSTLGKKTITAGGHKTNNSVLKHDLPLKDVEKKKAEKVGLTKVDSAKTVLESDQTKISAGNSKKNNNSVMKQGSKSVEKKTAEKVAPTKVDSTKLVLESDQTKSSTGTGKKSNNSVVKQGTKSVEKKIAEKVALTNSTESTKTVLESDQTKIYAGTDKETNNKVVKQVTKRAEKKMAKKLVISKVKSSKSVPVSDQSNNSTCSHKKSNNSVVKQGTKKVKKKTAKKLVLTKVESPKTVVGSDQLNKTTLKLKQVPTEESDPKLDEEVFVLLKEVKENLSKNKTVSRITCYSGVEKDHRTDGKSTDTSKDSYALDESSEISNTTKDFGESLNSTKENTESSVSTKESDDTSSNNKKVNKSSNVAKKTTRSLNASESQISSVSGIKTSTTEVKNIGKSKKKNYVDKQNNQDFSEEKNKQTASEANKSEGRSRTTNKISVREIVSLVPDTTTVNMVSIEFNPSRVLRSGNSKSEKINNTNTSQSNKRRRTKLTTIMESEDSANKSQSEEQLTENKSKRTAKNKKKAVKEIKTTEMTRKDVKAKEDAMEKEMEKSINQKENENQGLKSAEMKSGKKNKSQQSKTEKPKEVVLTANVGTLKRKLQLKAVLEQQNANYEDDLFDSTPFRQTRKRKRAFLEDVDDDELFEELAKKQGKSRFETPAGVDVRSRSVRTLKLASARKTPTSYHQEEILGSSMKNLDGYVHNLKKRQILHAKRKLRSQTPKSSMKPVRKSDSPQKKLFMEFLREKKNEEENHQDSDCDDDYYWDEETT